MKYKDLFFETSTALLGNKIRSGLTILGIIIGIASVIALLAIGTGASNSIASSIQSLGANLVIVTPGAARGPGTLVSAGRGSASTLTQDDADAIASSIPVAQAVAPDVTTREQVIAKGTNTNVSIIGTVPAYASVRNIDMAEGNFVSDDQVTRISRIAIVGPTVVSDLFPDGSDPVGQSIRIGNYEFTIAGVTASKGGTGLDSSDDSIYIPITTAQHYFSGSDSVSEISVEADSSEDMTELQAEITSLLLYRHHISDPTQADFSTLNQSDIISAASSVTSTLTSLLAAVAGISLIVGGIGIMNMMLTTVTERTREIGLRKAVGAKAGDINRQFLVESILLTLVGGISGVVLGAAIALVVSHFGTPAQVSLYSILLAFGVSAVIGIVFGYYPARRAARMSPIDALRYE